ncbi:hypothetical protein ILUMI_13412 [Ignelater luminosus]|uniref:Uncharacterized protein n=1 Tax=Ignelater luminosus TaxID=2038154 RepID=A0A8K0CSF7_IGNLU|nr:hypothetical protein ILUMI_13412 [Ignelater luminosus]
MHGLHKSTVQRCVQNVCQKIVTTLFPEEIRWPTGEALASLSQQFMAVAGFPRKRLGSEEWELDADNDENDGEENDDVPLGTVQGKNVHLSLVRMFAAE